MVRTPRAAFVARLGIAGTLAGIAACSQAPQATQARLEPPPGYAARPSAAGEDAEPVEELTALGAPHDEDGDGFISPAEAEGFYRRYFGQLDDDGDGQLSPAELDSEAPGTPEADAVGEELVGVTEQEYLDDRLRRYDRRADPPMGMMSTKDFDQMLGGLEPALGGSRPGSMP